jgi:syntaxin-binding protein 5
MAQQGQIYESQPNAPGQAPSSKVAQEEGYWQYMQRQITERTERLGNLSESVDKLGETSAGWADEASKYVQKTKRNLVMGAVKSKFGV